MASTRYLFLLLTLLSTVIIIVSATTTTSTAPTPLPCASYNFPNNSSYAACNDLPVLDCSIHWNYHPSSRTLDIAFKKSGAQHSNWIAWAINPTSKGMVGSQAFVAFQKSNGTLVAYTSPITSYQTRLQPGNLSFPVHNVSASYYNGDLIIFAAFELPKGNSTSFNHLWQEGPVIHDSPGMHALSAPNDQSFGTLDFLSGKVLEAGTATVINSRTLWRYFHGILCGVSWGLLMPIGAILARYLKVFDCLGPAWFYLHVTCQCVAVLVGAVGFGTGFFLGMKSGVHHSAHRGIGIALMCSAILQVLVARFCRPKKDHKNRIFWNIFHYALGYGVIALAIVNVFKGFSILKSHNKWKVAYIGIIMTLACVAFILELFTQILAYRKKKNSKTSQQKDNIQQLP